MRVLIAHNYYQHAGGEDGVFEGEAALLEARGHHVTRFAVHNDSIDGRNKLGVAADTVWNGAMAGRLRRLVVDRGVEVAHFHNTFPLISPAAYAAVRSAGAAVVQTLHNHRLVCPNGVLCRDGHACTDCVGKAFAWPAVRHRCYRGSRLGSAVVALMQFTHWAAGTWRREVDLYIAPSHSTRRRLVGAGLPADRVAVKPHFVDPDPGPGDGAGDERGPYALFVGRLSEEKGLGTLLAAWELLGERARRGGAAGPPRLKVVGDGPLADLLRPAPAGVEWLGRRPAGEVYDLMGRAAALVFPSQCYETFGRVIAEAFARGTPVLASDLGSAPEMVREGVSGLLFPGGSAAALADCAGPALADPDRLRSMRPAARREFESLYDVQSNYDQLLALYRRALATRRGAGGGTAHGGGGDGGGADAGTHGRTLRDDQLGRRQPAGLAAGGTARPP